MMKHDRLKFIGILALGVTTGMIIGKRLKSKDTSDTDDDILIVDKSGISVCPNDEGEPDIL